MTDISFQSLQKYTFIRPGDELFPEGPIVIKKCKDGDVYVIAPRCLSINKLPKLQLKWDDYVNSLPQTEEDWVIPSSDDIKNIFDSYRVSREFIEGLYKQHYYNIIAGNLYLLSDSISKNSLNFDCYKWWTIPQIQYLEIWVNVDEERADGELRYNCPVEISEVIGYVNTARILPIQKIKFLDLYRYL